MKVSWTTVFGMVAAVAFGATFGPRDSVTHHVTQVDTVAPAEFYRAVTELAIEKEGLRARLEGRESRRPSVVVRTDTVVTPPDTVYDALRVTAAGTLTTSSLIRVAPDSVTPELAQGIPIGDCDEGLYVANGEVVCDRARFGHLHVLANVSLSAKQAEITFAPEVSARSGAYWEPSYRSPWRVSLTYGIDQRLEIGVSRGVKIF